MLCYRCGSHVPDGSSACPVCGQSLAGGGLRQATGTFSRRKLASAVIEGAPYKAGDTAAGRYLIRDCVGQGPVGFVFRALDKEIDVEVALKVVSPKLLQTAEERREFSKQLRAVRKINHDNIARMYEDGEHQDRPWFTSQFLEGLTLRKIIDLRKEKGQFFRVDEIEPILTQVTSALDEAHKMGLIHGDLKPENVLVLPDLLKVTDFGLGPSMPRAPFVSAQKSRKADRYLAPEYSQPGELTSAVDVYAVGVILGEMLGHVFPEMGDVPDLVAVNPAVPPELQSAYRRALNSSPHARFSSASDLSEAVSVAAGVLEEAPEPEATRPAPRAVKPSGTPQQTEVARRPPPRRPPPPIPLGASGEVEVTPSAKQPPPPPVMAHDPLPPPVEDLEVNRAAETAPITLPPSIDLPSAVDDAGGATEEPTQVMAPSPELLRKALGNRIAVAKPAMRISTPPSTDKGPLWIGLLAGVGVLAGILGGLAYRSHLETLQEAAEADQRQREAEAVAAAADAGRWAAILSALQAPDAGAAVADAGTHAEPEAAAVDAGSAEPHITGVAPQPLTSCPSGMAQIAAGTFKMGTRPDDPMMGWDEAEQHSAHTNAYCIDLYEFPNQPGAKPTTGVTFAEASAACQSQGKRLCTEEEWERACKGPSSSRFPWGDKMDPKACNVQTKQLEGAGTFDRCRSGYGVFDMAGNASEWTSSRYAPGAGGKATKGGSAASKEADLRCSARAMASPGNKNPLLGIRCCLDGPP